MFHPLPAPRDEDVAEVAAAVFRRVERTLAERESERAEPGGNDEDQFLLRLAAASCAGVVATGPRRGRRLLRTRGGPRPIEGFVLGRLCAEVEGFNLQAATRVGAGDREGLERMARYLARPPVSAERLHAIADGRLRLDLKRVSGRP